MSCIFDSRWCGDHGIGRFATEIRNRLQAADISIGGKPMSPFDTIRLSWLGATSDRRNWFLSPGYNGPLFGHLPYILTVHDLNHIDRHENSSIIKRIYYRYILRTICRRARAILTVSEFSRRRISEAFDVPLERVFCVGNGVSDVFSYNSPPYKKIHGYALCVSNRRGHKNEGGVLKAFALALPHLPNQRSLIFTGHPTDALTKEICRLGLVERVFFVGRVSEQELAALYRGAEYLVFPSFYEGFGLPIVEAFASGTPVITSNVSSMPEIAADAALLVDPKNVSEIADAMLKLESSSELRNSLRQQGFERAKLFTWDNVVTRVRFAVMTVNSDSSHPLNW